MYDFKTLSAMHTEEVEDIIMRDVMGWSDEVIQWTKGRADKEMQFHPMSNWNHTMQMAGRMEDMKWSFYFRTNMDFIKQTKITFQDCNKPDKKYTVIDVNSQKAICLCALLAMYLYQK